jgi:hypothetical protein
MSYTEYLRRKAATAPVVLDTRPKMDASTYTRHTRVVAASGVYTPTEGVINNIQDMAFSGSKRPQSLSKLGQGGSVPDASTFTDYAAGRAAAMDYKNGPPIGKLVLNGSLTGMRSVSGCSPTITLAPAPKTGSQGARDAIACHERIGEQHNRTDEISSKPVFVDDTISLNSGTLRIGTGTANVTRDSTGTITKITNSAGSREECSSNSKGYPNANHTPHAITPFASWSPRPAKGAGGFPVFVQPNPSDARKVGGLVPSDHLKYVEGHRGNDLNVNPRRIPIPYKIPAGSPAHLKINDP